MDMLDAGIVERFDLYYLAEGALEIGRQEAERRGLHGRVTFHHGDGFVEAEGPYDMVLWISALHHMRDVHAAVQWSREVLMLGGLFVMDEYVGPSRFQFPQEILDINTEYRKGLRKEMLVNPYSPDSLLDTKMVNIDIDELMLLDPSEAVDSTEILPAVRKIFPQSEIIFTGGSVYHFGMNDILHNMKDDTEEIAKGLSLDDECCNRGITQFAIAVAPQIRGTARAKRGSGAKGVQTP